MDILQHINPNILGIAIIVLMADFIIMMFIYIPRIDKLRKLEKKIDKLKSDRDYAIAQWSISMISTNAERQQILKLLKEARGRVKQSNDIRAQLANAYDNLTKSLGRNNDPSKLP